jgi:hypothetical protein
MSWMKLNCGDPVRRKDDPRHTGRVIKIENTPHLSAIVACFDFWREICHPAFSDFCNTICHFRTLAGSTQSPGQRGRVALAAR